MVREEGFPRRGGSQCVGSEKGRQVLSQGGSLLQDSESTAHCGNCGGCCLAWKWGSESGAGSEAGGWQLGVWKGSWSSPGF